MATVEFAIDPNTTAYQIAISTVTASPRSYLGFSGSAISSLGLPPFQPSLIICQGRMFADLLLAWWLSSAIIDWRHATNTAASACCTIIFSSTRRVAFHFVVVQL